MFQVLMILSLRILRANVMILSSTSPRIAGNMWDFLYNKHHVFGISNHPAANPRPQALISCHVGSLTGGEVSSLMGNLSAQLAQLVDTAICVGKQ